MHRSADYSSFKAAHHGEVRPTRWEIRPMAEKCASKSWATFLHTHQIEHKKQKQLKWWFQQAFICIWVCFSVTGSELKLSFLKENLPSPKYGIHLHCNPKWRAGSFPLDLSFTYSYSLLFLMDNEWKHSPVRIPTALFETDVLETTDKLPFPGRHITHSHSHSGPNCAVVHVQL